MGRSWHWAGGRLLSAGRGLALSAGGGRPGFGGRGRLVCGEEHGAEGLSCPTCSGTRGIQAPCRVPLLRGPGPGPPLAGGPCREGMGAAEVWGRVAASPLQGRAAWAPALASGHLASWEMRALDF